VQNFFDFWQMRAAIFVESEIWPNLIFEARKRGISTFLVNARMSDKSALKWRIAKFFGLKIFDYFAAIFAQSEDDKKRLKKLTNQEILLYGNLKSQAQNLDINAQKLSQLKTQIGKRKIFTAASTHNGEEEVILRVHQELKKEFSDLLTIIIPRHPNRVEEIKLLIGDKNYAQRSKNHNIETSTEIYLADSLGELGIFYSLTDFAFIGGSLVEVGGHNPFEAIKLGCAVISGSHLFNFKEIYQNLSEQKACVIVNSAEELVKKTRIFLTEKESAKAMTQKALEVIKNSQNIAGKIVKKMDQIWV